MFQANDSANLVTGAGKVIRAAAYMRMSTEHQRYSIPSQTAAIERYASSHGMVVVRTYVDSGRAASHWLAESA